MRARTESMVESHEHDRFHDRQDVHLNPKLWTWNCLTEWEWGDGLHGWGEDHDNRSAQAFRHYIRDERQEQT
jgi:hypothetical protein